MKKALKIIGVTVLVIVVFLLASPFIFQNKIKGLVKEFINENLNAKVDFKDASLSFLSSFPKANVTIDELTITNFAPFENEKLADIKSISFDFDIKELFKKAEEDPIQVKEIYINEALITLKTNKNGQVNWDIAKEKATTINEENSDQNFIFQLDKYAINNSALTYLDEAGDVSFYVTDLNHSGSGTFSEKLSDLTTTSKAKLSLKVGGTEYLTQNTVDLEAVIGLDLENNKYTFKENEAIINQLPVTFSGYFQQLENSQQMDISFKNKGATFKDFLAVLPAAYSKDLNQVNTTGNFDVTGEIKGELNETTIPNLDINIMSNNASFKYNTLPKGVKDIVINATIKNTTGNPEGTYVDLKTLNFKIDHDQFKSSALIKNLTSNIAVNANIDGVLNLANLTKAYPIDLENELTGILRARLNTSFDMDAIEKNAYQRIKNNGNLSLEGFNFKSEELLNPVQISMAKIAFTPTVVNLEQFTATTGKSDIQATGTLNNLLGFILSDKNLQGNFNLNSNVFSLNDFMSKESTVNSETDSKTDTNKKAGSNQASIKIPAFLDATVNAKANTVYYDNISLKEVKGQLVIKDQEAKVTNLTSNLFGGNLSFNGLVNTKNDVPTFSMNLNANQFNIAESFNNLELLQALAPLAKLIEGKLTSAISLSGSLNNDFTPNLATLTGNALAELISTEFKPKNEKVLAALENKLSFLDFSKLNLNNLKTNIAFNDGTIAVAPFTVNYNDIAVEIGGTHNLQNQLNYEAVLQVPAKYLGSDINRLIGRINDNEVNNLTIPVTANISGNLTSPTVNTDLTSGVKNLTAQLIEIEKQKLIGKGKDKIKDLLSNTSGGNGATKDSTKTSTGGAIKDVFSNVLNGGNSTPKDSTKSTSNTVKDVLSIFGKKKKAKDTLN